MSTRSLSLFPTIAGCVLVFGLAAGCGGGSSESHAASTTPTPTPGTAATAPADTLGATAQIKANWAAFFNGASTDPKRVSYLEDADKLKAILDKADPAASKLLSSRVTAVTFTSGTAAAVVYDVLRNGVAVLPGVQGKAVLRNGVWKVSRETFCQLEVLGNQGKPVPGCG